MSIEPNKIECTECRWRGTTDQCLTAPNPWDGTPMLGCPDCKSPDQFTRLCDEPGCKQHVSCGTPTRDGYRSTCTTHFPSTRPVIPPWRLR